MFRKIAKFISWASLLVLIVPALCFLADVGNLPQIKTVMLASTVIWFITAPMYMWKSDSGV